MTTALWTVLGLSALFAAVAWIGAYCSYRSADYSRRWAIIAMRRGEWACYIAERHKKAAGESAGRAAACEHSAICWVKAGRPQCEDDSDVMAAIMEEHKRGPIPADAACSDWRAVK